METQELQISSLVKDQYYQEEFQKIYDSGESYKGKWNWWAFFLSGAWALQKKMWFLFVLFSATVFIFQFKFDLSPGIYLQFAPVGVLWAWLFGTRGTWYYYKLKMKRRQPPF